MSTLTWLHLSDIHLQAPDAYNSNVVLKSLLVDIKERMRDVKLRPDFVAVTGDITYAGKADEFKMAKAFFDDLLSVTELPRERLFVVPGNHDVEREAISVLAAGAQQILTNRETVNKVLADDGDRALLFRRFRHYKDFIEDYFGPNLTFDDEHYYYVKFLDVGEQRVAILGLNSAWASGSTKDRNQLLLSEVQIRAALDAARGADLCIALMHHPFGWLQDFDRTDCEAMLISECQFVLHGHMHQVGILGSHTPVSETMIIAAGACYASSRNYPNSYNFVRINLNELNGKIYLRMYSDKQGGYWAADVLNYKNIPDGEYQFKLPGGETTVNRLVAKLDDSEVDPRIINNLSCYGAKAVDSLAALIDKEFDAPSPTALNLHTTRQRRAFITLARMTDGEAVRYLERLTPPEMKLVPAGSFPMGSENFDNEKPVENVWVSSFYLSRLPVTNKEYQEFILAEGYRKQHYWTKAGWLWVRAHGRKHPLYWKEVRGRSEPDHPADYPVHFISWYEAMAYCRWLALSRNAPYRLATEAEWEKAAGWDAAKKEKREYPWGKSFVQDRCNLANPKTSTYQIMPVGSFSPRGDSPYGIADMAGSVWEWVSSLRRPYPYKPDDGREDPEADGERVMRGGCWANKDPYVTRCACRYYDDMVVLPSINTTQHYEGPCGLRVALGFTEKDI